MDSIR